MDFVLGLHSLVRWIIVVIAVAGIVWFALSAMRRVNNPKTNRILMSAFTGFIDLQVLLGLIYILWSGITGAGFPLYRIEHAVTMVIAAAVAHLSMRWRKAPVEIQARNYLLILIAVLVIVFIGVSLLPYGWTR